MNEEFMKRAIELARKGAGFTSPNPCVGAVIVRAGRIIGEGWHKRAGGDHAEVMALKKIPPKTLKGADLYVTLEPCCHVGKTGPCVDKIIKAGFKRVFVGMIDPFKFVNGKSVKILRKNGIKVEICKGKLTDEVHNLNQPFIKLVKIGLPYVTLKAGMSLDGKIATSSNKSKWITGLPARKDAKLERSKCDAVLVGAGTVRADNPNLGDGLRVIIDADLSCNVKSKVFRNKNVFVACTGLASAKNRAKFERAGIEFKSFGARRISVKNLLKFLGKRGVLSVFVEGGSEVNGSFYDAGMIDKVLFYVAPMIIGGGGLPVIGGKGVKELDLINELTNFEIKKIGKDFKLTLGNRG